MKRRALAIGLLTAAASAGCCLADTPTLPAACTAHPTPDCLVDAAIRETTPKQATILLSGWHKLAEHDRKDLARRVLKGAEKVLSASMNRNNALDLAVAWHDLGDGKAAEKHLDKSIDIATPPIFPDGKPTAASIAARPGQFANDYWRAALQQVEWGQPDQARATLARMRADLPTLPPQTATDLEIRLWAGTRPDLVLALAKAAPERKDQLIWEYIIQGPRRTQSKDRLKAASEIDGAWMSARAYAWLASGAARDQPQQARAILETGIAAFAKATNDAREHRFRGPDPIAELAKAWFGLNDPARTLKTLDIRSERPDLFPATIPLPIDDYVVRASALTRLGRLDEALKTAVAATANFAARSPEERLMADIKTRTHGGGTWNIVLRSEGGTNDGDQVYEEIMDVLGRAGRDTDIRAIAAQIPSANPPALTAAVLRAQLSGKRWADAADTARMLPVKDWRYRIKDTAKELAHNGQDAVASSVATYLSAAQPEVQAEVFLGIADEQIKAGRIAAARETLTNVTATAVASSKDSGVRLELITDLAKAGNFGVAWDRIGHAGYIAFGEDEIVIAEQARAGDVAGALAHAQTALDINGWMEAILAVAAAM